MVKITTITKKESQNLMPNGMAESSVTNESEEMLHLKCTSHKLLHTCDSTRLLHYSISLLIKIKFL